MGGFVYILQSQTSGRYYIGSAIDHVERLTQHNGGEVTATRNKGPWETKFTEYFENIADARRIEYKLKKLKRRDILEQIIRDKQIKMK